jgi:hypothetical protein
LAEENRISMAKINGNGKNQSNYNEKSIFAVDKNLQIKI